MKAYTNTSTAPVDFIDGFPVKPCMKSGFCCTKSPCYFGEWNKDKTACAFLLPPNDIGQRDCGKYEWIKANYAGWETYPAFGAGCCMPLFNEPREIIINNIKNKTMNTIQTSVQEVLESLDDAVKDLSKEDYKEVMETLIDDLKVRIEAVEMELEDENPEGDE